MSATRSCLIIGAGMTGLTAAGVLQARGWTGVGPNFETVSQYCNVKCYGLCEWSAAAPQYAQAPVHVKSMYWISRRVLGRVHPEVFFTAQRFEGQEGGANIPDSTKPSPQEPVEPVQFRLLDRALHHAKLVVESQDLKPQRRSSSKSRQRERE